MELEEYKEKLEVELNSLISTRKSLDSMLKDMTAFTSVILILEKRVTTLEKKFENMIIEEALQEIGMYG